MNIYIRRRIRIGIRYLYERCMSRVLVFNTISGVNKKIDDNIWINGI